MVKKQNRVRHARRTSNLAVNACIAYVSSAVEPTAEEAAGLLNDMGQLADKVLKDIGVDSGARIYNVDSDFKWIVDSQIASIEQLAVKYDIPDGIRRMYDHLVAIRCVAKVGMRNEGSAAM